MGSRYWFRPKSFGYGATPVTWEGWALTFVSMAVTMIAVLIIVLGEVRHWPDRRFYQAVCLVVVAVTVIAMIIVGRLKTDGDWQWRS